MINVFSSSKTNEGNTYRKWRKGYDPYAAFARRCALVRANSAHGGLFQLFDAMMTVKATPVALTDVKVKFTRAKLETNNQGGGKMG